MNILLIRPKPHKQTINLQSFMICEPLELEYMATVSKEEGHEVEILDMILEKKKLSYFIKRKQYDLIGITGYLPHVNIINDYAKIIKKIFPSTKVVVGGVVAEVQSHVFENENIDYIIESESIKTFRELLQSDLNDVSHIEGIYKGTRNTNRELEIPDIFPDREITKRYRKHYNYVFHQECAIIKTSYGCAYNCGFCYCNVLANTKYKTRDLKDVIEEMKTIKEDKIFIVDDNFLYDTKRLQEFISLMKTNNIKKEFIAFGRTDFICDNEELLIELRGIGLRAVFIGLESFRKEELEDMNKRTTVQNNIDAIHLLDKLDIECYKGVIVQYDYTKEDFNNLVEHLSLFRHSFANIQPITPMYGTKLFVDTEDTLTTPQEHYHLYDMAHLVSKPTNLSRRAFYYQILKSYLVLMRRNRMRKYIKNKYGKKVYKRVRHGVITIGLQYVRLSLFGR